MSKITIVSAFININRDNWKTFGRSEEQYFDYFKIWAKIKNNIIVYVETKELKEKIINFRKKLGLEKQTNVIIVDNFFMLDKELYKSIEKVTKNENQKSFRTKPNNPEVWNASYDYIMLMKMWCVNDAIKKGLAKGMIAWVDFGYLHGGKGLISEKSDFNFEWKYEFGDVFHLFTLQEIDDKPIFEIVQNMDTYIMGTILIGPDRLWPNFWESMRNNMITLNKCGLVDDDQTIILMCYRENPTMYELHKSNWDLPMWQFGGEHLILNEKKHSSIIKKIGKRLKDTIINIRYSKNIFIKLQRLKRK